MTMLSNRLNKHFVAAAAIAVVGATQAANAEVVYSGIVNITIPATTAGVYLNLQTGANSTSPAAAPGWDINPWGSTNLQFFNTAGNGYMRYSGVTGAAGNLDLGQLIDASGSFNTANNTAVFGANAGEWDLNSDNLLGVVFLDSAAAVRFGWVRIGVGATVTQRSIVDYAYENSGAGLNAGMVPAPASLALFGLAGGMVARRRRA